MKDIIVGMGEALWDCLPEGRKLGGAPANFAYHVGQFGWKTVVVSAIGHDALGDEILDRLADVNLEHRIERVSFPTGTVQVTLSGDGIPTYEICENVAWDNIPWTEELEELAKETRAVCFGSLAQRSPVSRETINKFLEMTPEDCLKIFDVNLRGNFYNKEVLQQGVRHADILKINDEELIVIGRMFDYPGLDMEEKCRIIMHRYNLKMVVLTCGTNGSYVFARDGFTSFKPTPKVEVADTVGAGDSFTGAFTASILSGKSIGEAHEIAVKVSAYVCTKKGAMPKLPDKLIK